ncbi:MAG: alkaline phosphatase D family protein, partial [Flavobacteriaceae bacterium]
PYLVLTLIVSCSQNPKSESNESLVFVEDIPPHSSRIAFGSCNNAYASNELWDDIFLAQPEAWIWGGDIVYADSDDFETIEKHYRRQLENQEYRRLTESTKILATWDDHDYGMNDGGVTFSAKDKSQEAFLNFLKVEQSDSRRDQEGVYYSEQIQTEGHTIEVILLDTRYFRSDLTKGTAGRRYDPNYDESATMLGDAQWNWLSERLSTSTADLILLVSSIQFLSSEHGYEKWQNLPHERERLISLLNQVDQPVMVLSGDRHISEWSVLKTENKEIIDFTSSGLTHSYENFSGEPNALRKGEVVSVPSYGLLDIDWKKGVVTGRMIGNGNAVLQEHSFKF